MTKPKRKENNFIIPIFSLIFFFSFISFLSSEEISCKKFDLKCKTNKIIAETKNYQKKGLEDGKKQIKKTKEGIIKLVPKKN